MDRRELLQIAYREALCSPDPSTQNGAVLWSRDLAIPLASCNRFPRNVVETTERWERPAKYYYIEHAERNVLFRAARYGISTVGTIMACPWATCAECARAIIECEVKTLVVHEQALSLTPAFWSRSIEIGFQMLSEAGVGIEMFNGKIFEESDRFQVLHGGNLWSP